MILESNEQTHRRIDQVTEGTHVSGRSNAPVKERFPTFQPAALLRNGHAQTIFANLSRGPQDLGNARQHRIVLDDGDIIVLHENRPSNWLPTAPTALLVHGLAGCSNSGYMTRIAAKLNGAGVRAIRMDMRGCGAGEGLARLPYHPGISQDVRAALDELARQFPASPISLVGFSIGGNIILKLLGESPSQLPSQLDRAVAVNPPIDLPRCLKGMTTFPKRFYNRHFVGMLYKQLMRSDLLVKQAPQVNHIPPPRSLREFDTLYTADVWGFQSVDKFYEENSALSRMADIRTPTLVIASRDDPLVPPETFDSLELPSSVSLRISDHGGHLGFIGRNGIDPDRRWMDWRIIDWVLADQPAAGVIAA